MNNPALEKITKTVLLSDTQTAEPGTCGSCKYFVRDGGYGAGGYCRVPLPPWVAVRVVSEPDVDDSHYVRDTMGCALYSVIDMKFTKTIRWKAGENAKTDT